MYLGIPAKVGCALSIYVDGFELDRCVHVYMPRGYVWVGLVWFGAAEREL